MFKVVIPSHRHRWSIDTEEQLYLFEGNSFSYPTEYYSWKVIYYG